MLLNSVMASPMVKYRGPFVLQMPAEAWFDVNMMQKDLRARPGPGEGAGGAPADTGLANEFLTAAREMGYEEQDFAALFDVLATTAGVDPRPNAGQVERLPRVTPHQVMRALARDGWVIGREGRHTVLEHPAKLGNVVIPRHRETLKLGTLDNILKAAGLTREEFRRLL